MFHFLPPENVKNIRFSDVVGGIEMEHWVKMSNIQKDLVCRDFAKLQGLSKNVLLISMVFQFKSSCFGDAFAKEQSGNSKTRVPIILKKNKGTYSWTSQILG